MKRNMFERVRDLYATFTTENRRGQIPATSAVRTCFTTLLTPARQAFLWSPYSLQLFLSVAFSTANHRSLSVNNYGHGLRIVRLLDGVFNEVNIQRSRISHSRLKDSFTE